MSAVHGKAARCRRFGDGRLVEANSDQNGFEKPCALKSYNQDDDRITVKIAEILGFIPPHEQDIWTFDAGVNGRGLGFDVPLIDAAINIKPAQNQRILKWCKGTYWTAKFERNTARDARVTAQLEAEGWQVHTIWECETNDQRVLERLTTELRSRRLYSAGLRLDRKIFMDRRWSALDASAFGNH